MKLDEGVGSPLLVTGFVDDRWIFTLIEHGLTGCPLTPVATGVPPNPCDRQVATAILSRVRSALRPSLESMLGELPAPQFWNAAGEAKLEKQVVPLLPWNEEQNLVLYAELPE